MEGIKAEELLLDPMSEEELSELIILYKNKDPELSQAYSEMLDGCKRYPEKYLWYTAWRITLKKKGVMVGDVCFKGLPDNGKPEIGYGIIDEYQGNGYATKAVAAICRWAFSQKGVSAIEAETAPDNAASQRVLEKTGFKPTGTVGEEGPRFVLKRD